MEGNLTDGLGEGKSCLDMLRSILWRDGELFGEMLFEDFPGFPLLPLLLGGPMCRFPPIFRGGCTDLKMSVDCPKAANVPPRGVVIPCLGGSAARDLQPLSTALVRTVSLDLSFLKRRPGIMAWKKGAWHVWLHVAAGLGGEAEEGNGRLQLRVQHVVGAPALAPTKKKHTLESQPAGTWADR